MSLSEKVQNKAPQSASLLDYVTEAIVVADKDTRILYANAAAYKMLGFTKEDLAQVRLFDLVHPDDKEKVKEYEKELEHRSSMTTLRRLKKKDGTYAVIEKSARALEGGTNVAILRDVTERFLFEQRKDTFISIASHELRSPVNGISLYAETAKNALLSGEDNKAYQALQKIGPQVERLNNLIGDMLDLSKIQSGKFQFRMQLFDLNEVAKDAASEAIGSNQKEFNIDIRGSIKKLIYGDKDRIYQVVINLLNNAIKYSPNSHTVIMNMTEDDKFATVAIKDFGIGIKKDELTKIFTRFYQTPDSSKYTSGMGIGLYLSREIIRKHGGDINVESEYGAGSLFTFTLPFSAQTKKIAGKDK